MSTRLGSFGLVRRALLVATSFVSVSVAAPAWAQVEGEATGEISGSASVEATAPAVAADTGGAFAFGKGTMGIGVTFPTGGDSNSANFLYFLDGENALDLQLGFDLLITADQTDPATGVEIDGETVVGISLGGGYRMYKALTGRIRPFFEPGGFLTISDLGEAGDTIGIGAFAALGVELVILDQFTLGTAIGAQINFSNGFDRTTLGLFTNPIVATFYW